MPSDFKILTQNELIKLLKINIHLQFVEICNVIVLYFEIRPNELIKIKGSNFVSRFTQLTFTSNSEKFNVNVLYLECIKVVVFSLHN